MGMMSASPKVSAPDFDVRTSETPEGLATVHDPDCPAIIWSRRPAARFQEWIDDVALEKLPQARLMLRPEHVREAITHICDHRGTPDCFERDLLIDDAAALAAIYATIVEVGFLRLRFDIVDADAVNAPSWNDDAAQLICTYRGPGTRYGIARKTGSPRYIGTVPTGAPILTSGSIQANGPALRFLDMAPPMKRAEESRLVLTIQSAADPTLVQRPTLH